MAKTTTIQSNEDYGFYDKAVDVIVRPQNILAQIQHKPNLFLPLVWITLSTIVLYLIFTPTLAVRLEEVFIAAGLTNVSRLTVLILIFAGVLGLFQALIVSIAGGLLTHGLAYIMGGKGSVHQTTALYITATAIPGCVKAIIVAVIALFGGVEQAPIGLSNILVSGTSDIRSIIVAMIDPFFLWSNLLLAIGLVIIHKMSWIRAATLVILLFILSSIAVFASVMFTTQLS
ncbi:MAG: hypothetical protein GFH27_549347n84 [Chloroflexi bacterium AL-W]|nr:hypothetical protein [Chloroflexi bacterium AL-N5]NOK85407.1 hypothetical protein [Chloroflexi bacterium AL-W]